MAHHRRCWTQLGEHASLLGMSLAVSLSMQHSRNSLERRPDVLAALQDNTIGLSKFAGPGGFNDPDMLEVCCSSQPSCLVQHLTATASGARAPCDRCHPVVSCVQVGNPGLTEQVRHTKSAPVAAKFTQCACAKALTTCTSQSPSCAGATRKLWPLGDSEVAPGHWH